MTNDETKIEPAIPAIDVSKPVEISAGAEPEKSAAVAAAALEKEQKYQEALAALKNMMRIRNRSGSRNVPGAFGGAHPGTKRKKKFARYIARNTV